MGQPIVWLDEKRRKHCHRKNFCRHHPQLLFLVTLKKNSVNQSI